jgi:hypothetical protein
MLRSAPSRENLESFEPLLPIVILGPLFFTGGFVLVEEMLAVVLLSSVFETIKMNYCKLLFNSFTR